MTTITANRNFIGGTWVAAPATSANVNPSDISDIIGYFARAEAAHIDQAVSAAQQALGGWRTTSPQQRADMLDEVGTRLLADRERYGRLLAREEGKILAEAIGEVARAGQIFKFQAQQALCMAGEFLASTRPGVDVEISREPVGVVGLITPWNFPIAIPAWKVAPALAYGNCVILKPAELTPVCAHVLATLLAEAGCPGGVFNLVMGSGSELGQRLVDHPDVDAISFTGSSTVGRTILRRASTTMKRVQLEMGGKNPMVVMNDADLDLAVDLSLNGAFFSTGQRCTASSRLLVQSGIHDAFVEKLSKAMTALRVGDALDSTTQIGPVASENQLNSNLDYIKVAREEGTEVIGGELAETRKYGYYQRPALFVGATNTMRIAREEIFGPCAAVIAFDDFDEGLTLANDSEFGLSAGICTTSLSHARRFRRESMAGMVMVNLPTAGVDHHAPFGGRKGSSFGPRQQGRSAREFYTTTKTSYMK